MHWCVGVGDLLLCCLDGLLSVVEVARQQIGIHNSDTQKDRTGRRPVSLGCQGLWLLTLFVV